MRTFIEEFIAVTEDQIETLSSKVVSGNLTSFEEYKSVTARIGGLQESVDTIKDILSERLGDENDD